MGRVAVAGARLSSWIRRPEGRSRWARAGVSLCPKQGIRLRGPACPYSRRDPVADSEFGESGRGASGAGEARYSSGSRELNEQLPGWGTRRPPLQAFVRLRFGPAPGSLPRCPRSGHASRPPRKPVPPAHSDAPRKYGRAPRLLPGTGQPGASAGSTPPRLPGPCPGLPAMSDPGNRPAAPAKGEPLSAAVAALLPQGRRRALPPAPFQHHGRGQLRGGVPWEAAPRPRQEGAFPAGRAPDTGRTRACPRPGWEQGKAQLGRRPARRSLRLRAKRAPLGRDPGRESGDLRQNSGKTRRQPGSAKAALELRRSCCFRDELGHLPVSGVHGPIPTRSLFHRLAPPPGN